MFTDFSSFLLCQLHKLYIEINIYQVVKHLMPFFWKSVRSYTVADLAIRYLNWRLSVYAHEMDNFQRHVDFGLSVCESVSSFW